MSRFCENIRPSSYVSPLAGVKISGRPKQHVPLSGSGPSVFATTTSPPIDPGNVEAKLSCSNSLLFALDGLAMNLEKGYRPAGDFIIKDADYQPAGIPRLCIEVCPTFY